MEWVEVAGFRVGFERVETAPTGVVLLHGYVGDGLATWSDQLDALADSYTVAAWDAPGAGGSTDPPESLGMDGYADCLAEFIAALVPACNEWPSPAVRRRRSIAYRRSNACPPRA